MKKSWAFVAAVVVGCGLVLVRFIGVQPSQRNTAAFFSRNEAFLEDFIALCRAEASRTEESRRLSAIYTDPFDGALMCCPDFSLTDEADFPASSELCAAWERIASRRYITSAACSFDENGALEIHFSAEGEWVPYGTPAEGHYRDSCCLVWRDTAYLGPSHADSWRPLNSDNVPDGWYYISHKHYDG